MAARKRSSLGLAAWSDEEAVEVYDRHLERAEEWWDRTLAEQPASVRYRKYTTELFENLLQVRDALLCLASGERGSLRAAFGSDGCNRVARLLVLLNGGVDAEAEPEGGILQLQRCDGPARSVMGTAERLDASSGALRAYQSIAGVLDTLALAEAISRARERRKDRHQLALGLAVKLKRRVSAARRSIVERRLSEVQPLSAAEYLPGQTAAEPALPVEDLLARLDDLDVSSTGECDLYIDKLLEKFDTDGDGVLRGEECEALINRLAAYVYAEYEQKLSKYRMKPDLAMITQWVRDTVDQDGDGSITRAEMAKVKKVVDDID